MGIRIMSFIRKNLKAYFLTIILIICIQSTLNKKIKTKTTTKEGNEEYYQRMKQFFEMAMDREKLNNGVPKKCWDWIWSTGVESIPSIKAVIKQLKEGDIKNFLAKPNLTKIDVEKETKSLISSVTDKVKIDNQEITCKTELEKYVVEVEMNMAQLNNRVKQIFDIKSPVFTAGRGFVTSSISTHRDSQLTNSDLYTVLNSN